MIYILIIGILIMVLWKVCSVYIENNRNNSIPSNSKNGKFNLGVDYLSEIIMYIEKTSKLSINNFDDYEMRYRNYIINEATSELLLHPKYLSPCNEASEEVYFKVKYAYDQISPEAKMIKRDMIISIILN